MTSCSSQSPELVRARPLLGTVVEIRVCARSLASGTAAINHAFAAVARVHALMSPHDPASDVSRINRATAASVICVDPWTFAVLATSQDLATRTNGVFDISTRPSAGRNTASPRESWGQLDLLPRNRVRCSLPLKIDLGGIAKGFAVDRAVAALQRAGIVSGVVNAGGDLRVFGPRAERIHLRHPFSPGHCLIAAELVDEALATSANYFDPARQGRLVRPDGRRLWLQRGSVSVMAPNAMLADALCKVVAAIGIRRAAPVLREHHASALVLGRGQPDRIEQLADAA
ncbi:MAG: FAD:protein FMN transferase [Opitutus sp.]